MGRILALNRIEALGSFKLASADDAQFWQSIRGTSV